MILEACDAEIMVLGGSQRHERAPATSTMPNHEHQHAIRPGHFVFQPCSTGLWQILDAFRSNTADFHVWGCLKGLIPPFTAPPLVVRDTQVPSGAPRTVSPRLVGVARVYRRIRPDFNLSAVVDRKMP